MSSLSCLGFLYLLSVLLESWQSAGPQPFRAISLGTYSAFLNADILPREVLKKKPPCGALLPKTNVLERHVLECKCKRKPFRNTAFWDELVYSQIRLTKLNVCERLKEEGRGTKTGREASKCSRASQRPLRGPKEQVLRFYGV